MVTSEDIMQRAIRLKQMKSQDYQGHKFTEEDYFPFGDTSYLQMIVTKYNRIMNLTDVMHPNYESLQDSLIDMICYCSMYAAWIENQEKKGEEFDEKWAGKQLPEPQQQNQQLWQIQKDRT